jgi:hypothetical protein
MTKPRLTKSMSFQVQLRKEQVEKYEDRMKNDPRYAEFYESLPKNEDVTHRMRRGKLVEIPEEWRGMIPHKQTMRKRNEISRRTRKSKKNRG